MNAEQRDVRVFMEVFGQQVPDRPTVPSEAILRLRAALNTEEADEFHTAAGFDTSDEFVREPSLVSMADAILDLLYVGYGAANALGIDLEPLWDIVHAANMGKAALCRACAGLGSPIIGGGKDPCGFCGGTGRIVRRAENGKILKPEDWEDPEEAIRAEIERQRNG